MICPECKSQLKMENVEKVPEVDAKKVAEAILQKGLAFSIYESNPSLLKRILAKLHLCTINMKIVIQPIVLGSLLNISRILTETNTDDGINLSNIDRMDDNKAFSLGIKFIVDETENILKILGYAIVNKDQEPSDKLIKFLRRNLTTAEMFQLFKIVLGFMNVTDFLSCTVLLKTLNVVKTEKEVQEISGEPSEH